MPAHRHRCALVLFVGAGSWGSTALGGTAQPTRAVADGTPGPAEEIPVGAEVILEPGDWLFVQDL